MSLETTTHVRVLRGSTPTDGSQFTQTMSPRRMPSLPTSRLIQEPFELRALEIAQHLLRILAPRCIVRGKLAALRQDLALLQRLADQAPRVRGDGDLLASRVLGEPG